LHSSFRDYQFHFNRQIATVFVAASMEIELQQFSVARIAARTHAKTDDAPSRDIHPGGVGFETRSASGGWGGGAGCKSDTTSH
jgi:hypothetical protein